MRSLRRRHKHVTADKTGNRDGKAPKRDNRFITVFTDGSFCPDTFAYGCSFWIKDSTGMTYKDEWGGFNAPHSKHSESEALAWAVDFVHKNLNYEGHIIVIQSDCLDALNEMNTGVLHSKSKFVTRKHVRAHTNNKTKRTAVNRTCDERAYYQMSVYRNLVKTGQCPAKV